MKSSFLPIGVLFAIAGYATYSWADGIVKFLGGSLGIVEIGAFTTLFSLLPALLAKPKAEAWSGTFRLRRPVLVNIMAVLRVVSSVTITYSFVTIPLAEAYCLVFLIPVFITILSVLILKERVGIDRWVLVLVSFAGVLLVVRPGFRELELGHLTALICAISSGFAATITRLISKDERRISLFMLPMAFTCFVAAAIWHYQARGIAGWLWSLGIVLAAYLGLSRVLETGKKFAPRTYRFAE